MAWGKDAPPKPQTSTIRQLLPLVITFIILGVLAWVGMQIYQSVVKIQAQASQRMNKKNVVFTKDGVRVGVKQVQNEDYVDKTQSWVVKAWNLSGSAKEEVKHKKTDCHGALQGFFF
ncbi:hypothetical protein B0T17DRAFT_620943 [Bombardia bombarda]|uniref:Uncharacterized protein n=1 Tax=Bombardia bombarda TaxID=252184 RepID=A0AA39W9T8_9PEZI|nr:hypothetical protein B0T17DRAFT_620943 [Bombardia bombarda]